MLAQTTGRMKPKRFPVKLAENFVVVPSKPAAATGSDKNRADTSCIIIHGSAILRVLTARSLMI
jgi:hypothetical protein